MLKISRNTSPILFIVVIMLNLISTYVLTESQNKIVNPFFIVISVISIVLNIWYLFSYKEDYKLITKYKSSEKRKFGFYMMILFSLIGNLFYMFLGYSNGYVSTYLIIWFLGSIIITKRLK